MSNTRFALWLFGGVAVEYWVVTYIAWTWVLGLDFDVWKGAVVGLLSAVIAFVRSWYVGRHQRRMAEGGGAV